MRLLSQTYYRVTLMNRVLATSFFCCAIFLLAPRLATATPVTMSWSYVGNPGNANDTGGEASAP